MTEHRSTEDDYLSSTAMKTDDFVQLDLSTPSGHDAAGTLMSTTAAAKDIAFGCIAGMVAATFEYPMDLAKVRLQAQLLLPTDRLPVRFNGPLDCLAKTWKNEGVRGLYRGLPAPIVGAMAETAALFLSYSYFQNVIRSFTNMGHDPPLSLPQLALAAGGAGLVASSVLTPIELVKCRMQVQMMNMPIHMDPPSARSHSTSAAHVSKPTLIFPARVSVNGLAATVAAPSRSQPMAFTSDARALAPVKDSLVPGGRKLEGPWSILGSTIKAHGLRGLWLGHTGTMLREGGGSTVWFSIKEWIAARLQDRRRQQNTALSRQRKGKADLLPWESALAGGLAGAVSTVLLYPADTVKSAIQTKEELRMRSPSAVTSSCPSPVSSARPRTAFSTVLRQMYSAHGFKGLYAGCGLTVARAVPGSAIIFVVYDGLSSCFS
ncbi:hypothetical protein AX17_001732 [Amanita inopinata Kibby_2008]|nr:hypothetical protein AX17_001732 [Amanita inopinata Kibby_2008]